MGRRGRGRKSSRLLGLQRGLRAVIRYLDIVQVRIHFQTDIVQKVFNQRSEHECGRYLNKERPLSKCSPSAFSSLRDEVKFSTP
jgi:hypothetical protein